MMWITKAQPAFLSLCLILAACDTNLIEEDGFLAEPGPILFQSYQSGTPQLFSMQPDGSDVRQLTDDPDFPVGRAVWSPDGTKIVFEGPQESRFYGPALYVVNADGTGRYRLTNTEMPGVHLANGEHPVWSPDGLRIAFRRIMMHEALGILDIYVVNIDGTNEQRVTDTPNILELVTDWAPEGYLLGSIFDYTYRDSLGRAVDNGKLVTFDLDGGYRWTWGDDGDMLQALLLSPDGKKLAFKVRNVREIPLRTGGLVGHVAQEEIFVMNADGSNVRRLTNSEHRYMLPVAWSPDGERLLVQAGTPPGQGMERILVVTMDGDPPTDITPCPQGEVNICIPTSWRR